MPLAIRESWKLTIARLGYPQYLQSMPASGVGISSFCYSNEISIDLVSEVPSSSVTETVTTAIPVCLRLSRVA